ASAIVEAPAVRLHGLLASRLATAGVQLQGVDGSLARGNAAQVGLNGNVLVRDLAWTLQYSQLLLGRASFKLAGGRDGTLLDGRAARRASGALSLDDLRPAMPLPQAFAAAGYAFVPVQGQLGLDLQHLMLRGGWPQQATGT